jgi:hypothetical protein
MGQNFAEYIGEKKHWQSIQPWGPALHMAINANIIKSYVDKSS